MDSYQGLRVVIASTITGLQGVVGSNFNAFLYFESSSGAVLQDDLGNYSLSDTEIIKVRARLSQKKDPMLTVNPGVDYNRTYLEGNLVCPPEIIGSFPNYLKCDLKRDNQWITGKFTFTSYFPHALSESVSLASALGQKICGYFEQEHTSF